MLSLNVNELSRWMNDNCDYTHNLRYPLNSDSIIILSGKGGKKYENWM